MSSLPPRMEKCGKCPSCTHRGRQGRFLEREVSFPINSRLPNLAPIVLSYWWVLEAELVSPAERTSLPPRRRFSGTNYLLRPSPATRFCLGPLTTTTPFTVPGDSFTGARPSSYPPWRPAQARSPRRTSGQARGYTWTWTPPQVGWTVGAMGAAGVTPRTKQGRGTIWSAVWLPSGRFRR